MYTYIKKVVIAGVLPSRVSANLEKKNLGYFPLKSWLVKKEPYCMVIN